MFVRGCLVFSDAVGGGSCDRMPAVVDGEGGEGALVMHTGAVFFYDGLHPVIGFVSLCVVVCVRLFSLPQRASFHFRSFAVQTAKLDARVFLISHCERKNRYARGSIPEDALTPLRFTTTIPTSVPPRSAPALVSASPRP